jgi:aspartate aminotransferase-like enzyme
MAKEHGAFSVIDAISSLGGYSIPVDEWGIDICITGSQKCIAAPPGTALLSVSKQVVNFLKDSPPKTRYFDIQRYLEFGARGETPFTPALPLYYALRRRGCKKGSKGTTRWPKPSTTGFRSWT